MFHLELRLSLFLITVEYAFAAQLLLHCFDHVYERFYSLLVHLEICHRGYNKPSFLSSQGCRTVCRCFSLWPDI